MSEIGLRKSAPRTKDTLKTSSEDGYLFYFAGDRMTLEEVFGDDAIGPAEMTTRLWKHIRDHVEYAKIE